MGGQACDAITMLRKAIDIAHLVAIALTAAVMAVVLWQLLAHPARPGERAIDAIERVT